MDFGCNIIEFQKVIVTSVFLKTYCVFSFVLSQLFFKNTHVPVTVKNLMTLCAPYPPNGSFFLGKNILIFDFFEDHLHDINESNQKEIRWMLNFSVFVEYNYAEYDVSAIYSKTIILTRHDSLSLLFSNIISTYKLLVFGLS